MINCDNIETLRQNSMDNKEEQIVSQKDLSHNSEAEQLIINNALQNISKGLETIILYNIKKIIASMKDEIVSTHLSLKQSSENSEQSVKGSQERPKVEKIKQEKYISSEQKLSDLLFIQKFIKPLEDTPIKKDDMGICLLYIGKDNLIKTIVTPVTIKQHMIDNLLSFKYGDIIKTKKGTAIITTKSRSFRYKSLTVEALKKELMENVSKT